MSATEPSQDRRDAKPEAEPKPGPIPNAATRRAMRSADAGKNLLGPFEDVDAMFRKLLP